MFSSCDGENLYIVCFSDDEMKLYSKFKGSRKLWERLEEPDEIFGVNQKEAGKYFKGKSKDETKQILSGEAKTGLRGKTNKLRGNVMAERNLHNSRAEVRRNTHLRGLGIDELAEKTPGGMKDRVITSEDRQKLNDYRAKRAAKAPKPTAVATTAQETVKNNLPAVTTPSVNVSKNAASQATKKASGQYLQKGMKFVKNHKVGVGLGAAGLTAAGATGAYLYNKKKNQ